MDNFIVFELLSEGNFCNIYKGINKNNNQTVIIKKINNNNKILFKLLKREYNFYVYLKDCYKIPKCLYYNKNDILVFEKKGDSLDILFERYNRYFNKKTIYFLYYKSLEILKDIHNLNIIHRDIKPDNFLLEDNELYIIDFAYSDFFNENIKFNLHLIGTRRYASINNHKGISQSYRDDLESLFYSLYYLEHGTLPWFNSENDILNIKIQYNWTEDRRCEKKFIDYIKKMEFNEKMNYDYWISKYYRKFNKINDKLVWEFDRVNIHSVNKTKKIIKINL